MSDDFTIYRYTVKQGDTLCGIIKRAGKEHPLKSGQNARAVASQSGLRDPNLIHPGEVIVMYIEPPTQPHICRGCPVDAPPPAAVKPETTVSELDALLAELKKLLSSGGSKEAILAIMQKIIKLLPPTSSANEYALAEIIALLPEELQKAVVDLLQPSPRLLDIIVLHIQSARLKENETLLRALVQEKTLDPASYADAEMMLAQNLTSQGYIAEALDLDPEPFFTEAIKYLNLANQWAEGRIKDYPNAPWPNQIIARVQLTKAKIYLVRAGAEKNRVTKEKHLDAAKAAMDAFDKNNKIHGEIIWAELSLAYQTWGDLQVAKIEFEEGNKDQLLVEAGKNYAEAINLYSRNYEAMASLGDVYNWQEDYAAALPKYDQVLREAPPYSPARRKAQLGRYEALLRSENYTEIEAAEKFALETIVQETDGSFMIPRAAKFLLEIASAYMAQENNEKATALLNIIIGNETPESQRLKQIDINSNYINAGGVSANDGLFKFCDEHKDKYQYDRSTGKLMIKGEMTGEDKIALQALYSTPEDKNAIEKLFLLSQTSTARKILMMQAYLKLGQMAKAGEKDDEAKKHFDQALQLCKEIKESPEFDNLSAREKIEIKLGLAEARVINKEYLEAINIYRDLLEDPLVKDETRSRVLLSLADIYVSEWPDTLEVTEKISEEEKLEKAEFYFRMAATFYYGEESKETAGEITNNDKLEKFIAAHKDKYRYDDATKTLIVKGAMREEENNELLALCSSPDEIKVINSLFSRSKVTGQAKLIYARALLGLGEMRRYGNDKHQKTALKYYSKALKVLGSIPEGRHVREKNAVACKAHYGKAKSYEVLANKVEAQKESDAAIALIKNLPKAEHGQVRRNYARTRDPIAARFRQAKGVDEYGNTWVEHQYETEASIPVAEKTVLKVTDRYNTAKHATIHSTYVGVEQQVAEGVAVRVDGKVPGSELKLESGEEVRQFSNPDVALQMNIEKEHYSGSARGEFYFNRHWNQLNAYSADSYWKEDLKNVPLIKKGTLRLGVEANYYTFPYEDTFPTKLEVNPTIKFDTDLFGVIGWGYDIVRLNLMAQLVTKTHIGELEPGDKYRALIGYGFGLGMDVDLTHLILLMLRSHADAPSVIFSANYRYKEDPRFTQSMFTMDANLAPLIHWLVDKAKGR